MPELPDVESFRRCIAAKALNTMIADLRISQDRILESSPKTLRAHLEGRKLTRTHRHGKYLFASISQDEGYLFAHFGMTGFVEYYKGEDGEPRHARVVLNFENSYHLAFTSRRKLGKLGYIRDMKAFIEEKQLGPDALEVSREEFIERLAARSGKIKPTLMNQKVVAGIGNAYADEILFKARIHPEKGTSALDESELKNLYNKMQQVLKKAIDVDADPGKLPRSYLIPRREEGEKCPACGGEVKPITISGRRGYYCPECQKR